MDQLLDLLALYGHSESQWEQAVQLVRTLPRHEIPQLWGLLLERLATRPPHIVGEVSQDQWLKLCFARTREVYRCALRDAGIDGNETMIDYRGARGGSNADPGLRETVEKLRLALEASGAAEPRADQLMDRVFDAAHQSLDLSLNICKVLAKQNRRDQMLMEEIQAHMGEAVLHVVHGVEESKTLRHEVQKLVKDCIRDVEELIKIALEQDVVMEQIENIESTMEKAQIHMLYWSEMRSDAHDTKDSMAAVLAEGLHKQADMVQVLEERMIPTSEFQRFMHVIGQNLMGVREDLQRQIDSNTRAAEQLAQASVAAVTTGVVGLPPSEIEAMEKKIEEQKARIGELEEKLAADSTPEASVDVWAGTGLPMEYQNWFYATCDKPLKVKVKDPNKDKTNLHDYEFVAVLVDDALVQEFYGELKAFSEQAFVSEESCKRTDDIAAAYKGNKPEWRGGTLGRPTERFKTSGGTARWTMPSGDWFVQIKNYQYDAVTVRNILYLNKDAVNIVFGSIIRVLKDEVKTIDLTRLTTTKEIKNTAWKKGMLEQQYHIISLAQKNLKFIPANYVKLGLSCISRGITGQARLTWQFENIRPTKPVSGNVYYFSGLEDGIFQLNEPSYNELVKNITTGSLQKAPPYFANFDPDQFFHAFNLH